MNEKATGILKEFIPGLNATDVNDKSDPPAGQVATGQAEQQARIEGIATKRQAGSAAS